jgi:hypothetical protein
MKNKIYEYPSFRKSASANAGQVLNKPREALQKYQHASAWMASDSCSDDHDDPGDNGNFITFLINSKLLMVQKPQATKGAHPLCSWPSQHSMSKDPVKIV